MEVQRQDDGKWHFALGPVERWIVGLACLAGLSMFGYIAHAFDQRLVSLTDVTGQQGKALQEVLTAQAVTNARLETLTVQLAPVPALTRQAAEMKVQIDRNTSDIRDLRAGRADRQ
ncbi:MAG: hypothetical protein ACK5LJ_17885 [Paracoccus sp. (in: a-proteobacteria)]